MYRQVYLVRVKGKVIDRVFMRKIVDIRSFSIPYYTPNLIFITFDVHKKFIKLKYINQVIICKSFKRIYFECQVIKI